MFDDLEKQTFKPTAARPAGGSASGFIFANKKIILIAAVVIFGAALFWLIFSFYSDKSEVRPIATSTTAGAGLEAPVASGTSKLPVDSTLGNGAGNGQNGSGEEELKAESLTFAHFYAKDREVFTPKPAELTLPLYAKTDVSNYYEVSRKIDLSRDLNKINQNGSVILDNPFAGEADNFYALYDLLIKKEIPQLITSDFLLYYYQNRLKEAFKEIEENVFYNDVWQINKEFFANANSRYKQRKEKVGLANDPVLEGERLEAAFFAVSLELLKPRPEQINQPGKPIDDNKFSEKEALDFSFELPDYLKEDVLKEVELIIKAKAPAKSPVLLYQRNYQDFVVPADYKNKAKLNNFYLASRWLNSVFPLYYRNGGCAECLLDKNDWLINFIATTYIAKDFSDNQELKNRWAKVYKIMSFFRGLRQDLTYLHYQGALTQLYGENYQPEQIFSSVKPSGEETIDINKALLEAEKIERTVADKYRFSLLEGSFSRAEGALKPILGMRLLQEAYWPADYIFSRLIDPAVGPYLGKSGQPDENLNLTFCVQDRKKGIFRRCNGFGLDIINLITPLGGDNNNSFKENTVYKDYVPAAGQLGKQLDDFTAESWHNNNFWTTLLISRESFFSSAGSKGPLYAAGQAWREKNINTALGAWVNLQLPADKLTSGWQAGSSLGAASEPVVYLEPNLALANELIANTRMLSQMFLALRVIKDIDLTSRKMNELSDELEKVKSVIKKELSGEPLEPSDQAAMGDLIRKYVVAEEPDKTVRLKFGSQVLKESIKGVKLIVAVYELGDKEIFVAGPVFNYRESK